MSRKSKSGADEYVEYYNDIDLVKRKLKELDQRRGKSRRSGKQRRTAAQQDMANGKRVKKSDRRGNDRRKWFDPETATPDMMVKHLIQLERRISERELSDRRKEGRLKKQFRQK